LYFIGALADGNIAVCKACPAHVTRFTVLQKYNHSEEINAEVFTPKRNVVSYEYVTYIQNLHLKLYLYFSDKLLLKRTGILETFVSRWFSNWHSLLEADRSYFHTVNYFIN